MAGHDAPDPFFNDLPDVPIQTPPRYLDSLWYNFDTDLGRVCGATDHLESSNGSGKRLLNFQVESTSSVEITNVNVYARDSEPPPESQPVQPGDARIIIGGTETCDQSSWEAGAFWEWDADDLRQLNAPTDIQAGVEVVDGDLPRLDVNVRRGFNNDANLIIDLAQNDDCDLYELHPDAYAIGREFRIDIIELYRSLHLPIAEVAAKLKLGVTRLKACCRMLDIPTWPGRELRRIAKTLKHAEEAGLVGMDDIIGELIRAKRMIERDPRTIMEASTKKLRETIKKKLRSKKREVFNAGVM